MLSNHFSAFRPGRRFWSGRHLVSTVFHTSVFATSFATSEIPSPSASNGAASASSAVRNSSAIEVSRRRCCGGATSFARTKVRHSAAGSSFRRASSHRSVI